MTTATTTTTTTKAPSADGAITEYVTTMIGGQLFGMPISRVQDVFMPERLTRVPLSSSDVAGVLNLRGRIVTAIDACVRALACRRTMTASRRWLWASISAVNLMAC